MAIQRYTAKVSDVQPLGDTFVYLSCELVEPHRISFEAGQYILLDVPGTEQKKSYSITSDPSLEHKIELLVNISPKGLGSSYLGQLKPGDGISFMAPAGKFTVAQPDSEIGKDEKTLTFVATGSGITPLRSMILDQLNNKKDTRKMILYWGLRTENNMFWEDDFLQLSESYPNFTFHPVLSQAGPEWPFCRGRVTSCLSLHPMLESSGYYLCGSHAMIEDVSALLLNKGIEKQHIHKEEFFS